MSTATAAMTVAAILAISLTGTYLLVRRAARTESTRDRIIREAHERAAAAREVDDLELLYNLPAYDPDGGAGMDRLRDAVRDNQNHHKGDS